MKVVLDIETNSLTKPTNIHCIVCKDIDTGEWYVFREPTEDNSEGKSFKEFIPKCKILIGHNILQYDYPVIRFLLPSTPIRWSSIVDTLILSKLADYSRKGGHSLEQWGTDLNFPKLQHTDFDHYSPQLEAYCSNDVELTHKVYTALGWYHSVSFNKPAIILEHRFQRIVNNLHHNGFAFSSSTANILLTRVKGELDILDEELNKFPVRFKFIKQITPKVTKYGTLNKSDFRFIGNNDLSEYNGGPFSRISHVKFNPSSHKQIIDVLNDAGWSPVDKTTTHIDFERSIRDKKVLDKDEQLRYNVLKKYGWKVNEINLATLPKNAPAPARTLARRILLESRRRTLTEWLGLVTDDGRIHGTFQGIGAWTHRMAHQKPNTANIPNEYDTQGNKKLLGKELRSLWRAPKDRLLVGVDAEGIQLRIFAHYIDDKEFTNALVQGSKTAKTDPHSVNQRVLGSVCRSRQAAKRFLYALLLGAGIHKLAEILGCSDTQAREALNRLLERYTGFRHLKESIIPRDASKGYFIGLDGRKVQVPGDTVDYKKHLMMSGYLQNGEAIIMKKATLLWHNTLEKESEHELIGLSNHIDKRDVECPYIRHPSGPITICNLVHDEWQTECPNDVTLAKHIAKTQCEALRQVGEELKLKCPMAGSYWNDDHKDYTIGTNWSQTH